MHPLTVSVPDIEVPRSDIVAARLARKIAPLFGLVWEGNPFDCTWVCDFATVTLAEISRGAPLPAREEQARLDADLATGAGWALAGRAVWTPGRAQTPAALANTTVNRYGPDTKAAVLLTGVNRLLREATEAVSAVCRRLAASDLVPEVRLAVWAGLVIEVYRGQPAVLGAAIQARGVQRALKGRWGSHVDTRAVTEPARCEIDAERPSVDPGLSPDRLDLVDATVEQLALASGPGDASRLADELCRRLLDVGRPGRGVAWLHETTPRHRTVQTYLPLGPVVAGFVTAHWPAEVDAIVSRLTPEADPMSLAGVLPAAPPDEHLRRLSPYARRVHALVPHCAASYLRARGDVLAAWPPLRRLLRRTTSLAVDQATRVLGPDDPVSLVIGTHHQYTVVDDLCRSPARSDADLREQLTALLRHRHAVAAALRHRRIDDGTASYLLELCAVAAGPAGVLRTEAAEAADAGPGAEIAGLTGGTLDRWWRDALRTRGIGTPPDATTLAPAQTYYLQGYVDHLSRTAVPEALGRAFALQGAIARVCGDAARTEPADRPAAGAARAAHEGSARIAADLLTAGGGGTPPAALSVGLDGVRTLLADPGFDRLARAVSVDCVAVATTMRWLPLLADAAARAGNPAAPDAPDAPAIAELMPRAVRLLRAAADHVRAHRGGARAERALVDAVVARFAALGWTSDPDEVELPAIAVAPPRHGTPAEPTSTNRQR